MRIRFKNPRQEISLATALVCSAMPELYPILGRFATREQERANAPVAWRLMQAKMVGVLNRSPLGDFIAICDASMNSPKLVEEGAICILVTVHPPKNPECYGGYYTLRHLDTGLVEMDYHAHSAAWADIDAPRA